jgi:broad specificity phosphatase PhoE
MRHAMSEANARDILAGQIDSPLSDQGFIDAESASRSFCENHTLDTIISSPLLRARQTAGAFARNLKLSIEIDNALIEQDLGVFAGKTYTEVESDPEYQKDKTLRWEWHPPKGESYSMIADRVRPFFFRLDARKHLFDTILTGGSILIVSHAVTIRLIIGLLQDSLPQYPIKLLRNSEIVEVDYHGLGAKHELTTHYFGMDYDSKA